MGVFAIKSRPAFAVRWLPDNGRRARSDGICVGMFRVPRAKDGIFPFVGIGYCRRELQFLKQLHKVKAGEVAAELKVPGDFLL